MTDLHAFKFAGKLLIACFIGNILGNLLGNWRNRRMMRKYMPDDPSKIDALDPTQWRPHPSPIEERKHTLIVRQPDNPPLAFLTPTAKNPKPPEGV